MKKQSIGRVVRAGMVLAGLAFTGLVYAQPGAGMTGGPGMAQGMSADRQEQMQSLQQMSGVMHDMSGQMMTMSKQMSGDNMSPAMQKQMAQRMQQMSDMMGTMSGMMAQGMMRAGTQSKIQEMRHGMDGMMQSAPAGGK